ncbi:MATE family efflux transporter [Aurantiacibacter rhizosphaerae]|uniref:MATE family efflux transporter n=1 Tax=Aurantiacibacter rhizosphaerae TaxID=2691582 RepID=A0A844XBT3_9SPHN|nr:MATE family efflux transporter [Aurantiacibacter rhizosphaerae]MWV27300.1 MATE family efflux transporter [Aurantiacibacter rhizosphaerae]
MSDPIEPAAPPPEIRGDLTQGPIPRTLLMFAVPALLTNILQSLSGTVNAIWVGRLIGEEALAATANANIVMFLVASMAFGFGMAATVLIGQRWGARNIDGARRTFGTAVGFCALLMVLIAAIGFALAPALLRALATPGGAYPLALIYLRLIFLSMPFGMISIILSMGLRGTGDAKTPLIFMGVTVLIDAVLNPVFIAGIGPVPEMGIAGSATATIVASMTSFVAMVIYVYRRDLPLRLRGRELRYLVPARAELGFIVSKGLPMGAQMLVMSAAGIILVGLVNREGLMTTAAYGATMQLFTYIQMPAMAIGGAVSAMAAQYIGAGKWNDLHAVTRAGLLLNLAFTGMMTLALLLFDRPVLELFLGPDSPAVDIARHIQLLASWNFVIFGVLMVYTATMRAAGAVWVPLLIMGLAVFPARLGFYYATYDWLGADSLWLSYPFSAMSGLILGWLFYYRWNWRGEQPIGPRTAEEGSHTDGLVAGRMTPDL